MTGSADKVVILGITDQVHAYMLGEILAIFVFPDGTTTTHCNYSVAVIAEATNH
jgi:hypothetical protein